MAKGNLFLGTSRNSVGDVVMYRRDGAQVSRVRVRKVANPKTDAQCLQRVFFSPVARFYAPLAITLAKSFEGLSKSKSYSKFLKTNIERARANGWYLPKGMGFFPLPYKLSEGTLPSAPMTADFVNSVLKIEGITAAPGNTTVGDLSAIFKGLGYKDGDVVSFIIVIDDDNDNYVPNAIQFNIDATSTVLLNGNFGVFSVTIDSVTKKSVSIESNSGSLVAGAVIVSRWENEKWRRSTQSLLVDYQIFDHYTDETARAKAIASYQSANGEGNPQVYLDGEDA